MKTNLGLTKLFLVSGLLYIATAVVCPDSSQWKLRSRARCNSSHPSYNCLYDESTSTFQEFCTIRPDFQRPGYKFIIRGNIDGIQCERNRFQPIKFWTNGSNHCILEKTHCKDSGQVIHDEGNSTSDRTCRCDYTSGFTFVKRPEHSCYCNPSIEDCSCFIKPCSDSQVMTPDYNCIKAIHWTGIFKCPVIMKSMTTNGPPKSATNCPTPTGMHQSSVMMMVVKKHVALKITLLVMFTVIVILVFFIYGKKLIKCYANINTIEDKMENITAMRKTYNDNMKLIANYKDIITIVNSKDIVKSLTLTDNEKEYVNSCLGRIKKNKALLDIVINGDVETYNQFIDVLHQTNPDLAEQIENTKESDYQKEYDEKYENIYNERIPEEVRRFHDKKIEDWKLKDKLIIETQAFKNIRECLTTSNCIVVVGCPGSGKSSILRHIALALVEENDLEDYDIIPVVVDPSKILEYFNDRRNQIFVIDNFCGKDKLNNQLIDVWKLGIESIYSVINNTDCFDDEVKEIRNKKTKILISCNNSVYNNKIFDPLKKLLMSFVCMLSEFPLADMEREKMINTYAPEALKNKFLPDGKPKGGFDFPLMCKLSANKSIKEIKMLFDNPHEAIENDLKKIQATKPLQFCAITLCTLFNNKFKEKWLDLNCDPDNIHVMNAVNEVFLEFNLELKNDRESIKNQFDQEKLHWLSKSGDTYYFVHEHIFTIASVICGNSYTQCFINHASSAFIAQRFNFTESLPGLITLGKVKDEKQYLDRLIKDLERGITYSTFQNIQLKNENYRKKFIDYCQKRKLKVREILGSLKNNNATDITERRQFCADCNCRKGAFCFDLHSVNIPLIECAWLGYEDMVELLLDMKCDKSEKDAFGRTALFVASAKGHIEIVKRLVENKRCQIEANENDGNQNDGNLEIKENQRNKSYIALTDKKERTPLHVACEEGHLPVIKYLIEEGANISAYDVDGNSSLHMACVSGKPEVVEFLLKAYTDIGRETEIEHKNNIDQTPIIVASSLEGHDVVKLLLQYHANINATDNRGFTSLLTASMYGFSKTVQLLIDEHANILDSDNEERTALFIACKKDHLDTVKVLIKEGKNKIIDVCDWHHKSPFCIACSEGRTEIVKELIENEADIKADIDLRDEDSKSPLHVACERSHDKIVEFLLKNRAKKDTRDRHNNLPLHVACKVGNLKIVQLLYQPTSDNNCFSETNQWKETPLDIAQKQGHVNIVNYLKNNTQQL